MSFDPYDDWRGDTDEGENETVEIAFDGIKAETDKAFLLEIDGEEEWIPKSQIESWKMKESKWGKKSGTCEIPEWLAEEKGLI